MGEHSTPQRASGRQAVQKCSPNYPKRSPSPQRWGRRIRSLTRRLRLAIQAAKAQSMPKDNIDRAVKKSTNADEANFEEIRYEGFGPAGIGVIVEALTDNRNRAASEIRSIFAKSGGNLGETGAVSFMFDRVGFIQYPADAASEDAVMEAAIEAGADDVISAPDGHEVYCAADQLDRSCTQSGGNPQRTSNRKINMATAERNRNCRAIRLNPS